MEQKRIFETYCNNKRAEKNIFVFTALLKRADNELLSNREGMNENMIKEEIVMVDGVPCILTGILAYWHFSQVIFGEHLAINKKIQGMGMGKIAINHLKEIASAGCNTTQNKIDNLTGKPKTILLEIELPVDFITKRRESFYKKLDFKENSYEHFQPCYHKGDEPIEMVIMTWPEIVESNVYDQFKREQDEIMPKF